MNIDCHFIAFNESETIHLTIKHYQKFCRQVYVYDNFSTDNTREIAEAMGCVVKPFGIAGQLNDLEYKKLKNNIWKGSDADWVIVCDADEILLMLDPLVMLGLAKENGFTVINPSGFSIFSNEMPKESWTEILTGVDDPNYSKLVCFRPDKIKEITYEYGCHKAEPQGEVKYFNDGAILLHYKNVGGANRLADRHALYAPRMSDLNKKWGLGKQYLEPRAQTIKYFNENLAKARPLW